MTDNHTDIKATPLRRRRWLLVALGVFAVIVVVAAASVFQPWRLFTDNVVDEALPGEAPVVAPGEIPVDQPTTVVPASEVVESTPPGSFVDKDHPASGSARVVTLGDGSRILRLEDFATDNGPDLFVYLSPADSSATGSVLADGAINLGTLKGNIGNQNYEIPVDVDLADFASVVIWCRQFSSAFGAAPLIG